MLVAVGSEEHLTLEDGGAEEATFVGVAGFWAAFVDDGQRLGLQHDEYRR